MGYIPPTKCLTCPTLLDIYRCRVKQIEEDMKNIETNLIAAMVNLLIQIVELEKVLELNQEQIK